jgi:gamma-glutamyltranspeptidase/glutathione hydrolase
MQSKAKFLKNSYIFFVYLIIGILACKPSVENKSLYPISKSAQSDSAMVVTAHPLATSIGLEILRQGGNVVDAAIAVQFALFVILVLVI